MSLPVRECGLKLPLFQLVFVLLNVTPRAGVWIEILEWRVKMKTSDVTPRAGVWIEIEYYMMLLSGTPVTPRAGVWIEIIVTIQ